LYGDVLSDIVAQIAGSVGLAGSANVGEEYAMFEAIHGSAPRRAGQNVANPSGLLHGAIMMLNHIGQNQVAERVHNAWLKTLEDGIHTYDIYAEGVSKQKVSTTEFADAVIERLGLIPTQLKPVRYESNYEIQIPKYTRREAQQKELKGVDVFVHWRGTKAEQLGQLLSNVRTENLALQMISNRGIKVWPQGFDETFCTDHWRCRFTTTNGSLPAKQEVLKLQELALALDLDVIKTENLYQFDGKAAYSLGQGQ